MKICEESDKIKLTKTEMDFCKVAKCGFIARDKDGKLFVFNDLPIKLVTTWCNFYYTRKELESEYFSFITWKDEPWDIQDLLKLEIK